LEPGNLIQICASARAAPHTGIHFMFQINSFRSGPLVMVPSMYRMNSCPTLIPNENCFTKRC